MSYAETVYFTSAPVAHCVAWEERQRARMIAKRNRVALESYDRCKGSRARMA